jgi:esterase/lipase superfamily enzyme
MQRQGRAGRTARAAWATCLCAAATALGAAEPAPPAVLPLAMQFEAARRADDLAGALELGRRALGAAERDADRRPRIDLLLGIAEVHERRGETREALAALEDALALREQELGTAHPDLVALLERIAASQQRAGRPEDAERTLQRAVSILSDAYGPQHLRVREGLSALRSLYAATGRDADAARVGLEVERLERVSRDASAVSLRQSTRSRRYTQKNGFASVRVYYGTNRAPTGLRDPAKFYGTSRGDLQFGYADVTIPETHKEGELETPSRWSMLTLDMTSSAARRRFILLQSVQPLARDRFLASLRAQMGTAPSRELLVFIHGYNNSFEDASRRVAQLVYDLDFDGTPALFSWPSAESTTSYTVDEATVGVSGRRFADFLQVVATEAGASRVHLIAHSMGNRALLDALPLYLAKRTADKPGSRLGQVVFTAPDVDRDLFMDAVPGFVGAAERLTLYASDNDKALRTSELLHGAPRAGLAGSRLVTLRGLDSIDMSSIEADLMGHSYFADNTGAMYDLFRLLWRGDPPPRRCGMVGRGAAQASQGWKFNVQDCSGQEILLAGVLFKRFGNLASGLVRARLSAVKEPEQKEEWGRILSRLDYVLRTGVAP